MIKRLLIIMSLAAPIVASAESIDECQQMAEANFPLVKRYDLISRTEQFTLSNIARGWLPQITAYAQSTYQSAVAELPEALGGVMAAQGIEVKGLSPLQYRTGLDIQQTIYDGGATAAARGVARAESAVEQARNASSIYNVRARVNEVYFGWLLIDERLKLNDELQQLLTANVAKLEALYTGGVATGSDVDALRAELATARQQHTELTTTRAALQQVLTLLCGKEIETIILPEATLTTSSGGTHPTLTVFDRQLSLFDAREKALRSQYMPKLGLFAQGYYGYTGLDMFRDMYHRSPTLNGIIGARLTWNISSLYTRRSDLHKLQTGRQDVEVARSTFLFNQSLESTQELQNVQRFRRLMEEDEEIVRLRHNVREAAEAKLDGGIIDTSTLLQEITRENQAAINHSIHTIEYLKAIYEYNNTNGQ